MSTLLEIEREDGTTTKYRRHANGRGFVAVGADVHPTALVSRGAYVESGAHVAVGAQLYEGAWIEEDAEVDAFAVVGAGARVGRHASVGHNARIGERAQVAPCGVVVRPAETVGRDTRVVKR